VADTFDRLKTALADRYAIEEEIGSGGMATVYLAEDLKHHRKVAVKVLRPELAAVLGADRFLKEIEVTANLQHAHILPLFDSGEADSFLYYVMPHVEGESLRDRLNRDKQLPVEEAVRIAEMVASALDSAHRHDIVHRDIKPENILLHEGQALVADFGIALAVSAAAGVRMTETGLSLGTPHYMSPEQATADRDITGRSDVYSLACVTYEMLAGDPPYIGNTAQAIIAKIISDVPRPVRELRPTVPGHVELALHKALEKLPADRFATAKAFAEALTNPAFTLPTTEAAAVTDALPSGPWNRLTIGLTAVAVILLLTTLWGWQRPTGSDGIARFAVALPAEQRVVFNHDGHTIALAPDGRSLVYVGVGAGEPQLYIREMGELEARLLPGTEQARDPFFSPDGRWIGFFAQSRLQKVELDGGPPTAIADAADDRGATWTDDDMIVFTPNTTTGLVQVPASGGDIETLTIPNPDSAEVSHRWPQILPGGKAVLFTIWNNSTDAAILATLSLADGEIKYHVRGAARGLYVETGHLVYVDGQGVMHAMPFDAGTLQVTGTPIPLVEGVVVKVRTAAAEFAVAASGMLAYLTGVNEATLVLVDREGGEQQLDGAHRWPDTPRFSPDGREIAFSIAEGQDPDIWIYDVAGSAVRRFTFEGNNTYPEWSRDGRWIGFSSTRSGSNRRDLFRKRADGSGPAEVLYSADLDQWEVEWSPSDVVLFRETIPTTSRDLWTVRIGDREQPQMYRQTPADEQSATVSPDGRWVAFTSDESGRHEVYVQAFPEPAGIWQVSTEGGTEPRWGPNGTELFYRHGSEFMRVGTEAGETFVAGPPRVLFDGIYRQNLNHAGYDVHPSGRSFVMIKSVPEPGALVVVLNWFEELKAKVGN
jgi:serine/threonine-protein kinase